MARSRGPETSAGRGSCFFDFSRAFLAVQTWTVLLDSERYSLFGCVVVPNEPSFVLYHYLCSLQSSTAWSGGASQTRLLTTTMRALLFGLARRVRLHHTYTVAPALLLCLALTPRARLDGPSPLPVAPAVETQSSSKSSAFTRRAMLRRVLQKTLHLVLSSRQS